MRIYRLYLLDADNDPIEVRELIFPDNEAAIAAAEAEPAGESAKRELWQSAHPIRRWIGEVDY